MKTTFLPSTDYKDYLKECMKYVLALGEKQFPIDKIGSLIGKENAKNLKFASGIVNISLLKDVLDNCSEQRVKMGFKYEDKQGVVKQRVSSQIYAKVVALNYEIRMSDMRIKRKTLWELPEIIELLPDLKDRKKHVGRFVNARCEGVINYEIYLTIKSCVIKYLSVHWPSF